jgi:hypothetical protein
MTYKNEVDWLAGLLAPYQGTQQGLPQFLPARNPMMPGAATNSTLPAGTYDGASGRWEQAAAQMAARRYGWGPDEFKYVDYIIAGGGPNDVVAESNWNPNAVNPSSGAYGIPQILPAAHPDDLGLGPMQQIRWLLNYIQQRYGSPENAYAHKSDEGWY